MIDFDTDASDSNFGLYTIKTQIIHSEYFQSLLKNANHEKFEVEWIREFVKALRCRDAELNKETTVSIIIFAGKGTRF